MHCKKTSLNFFKFPQTNVDNKVVKLIIINYNSSFHFCPTFSKNPPNFLTVRIGLIKVTRIYQGLIKVTRIYQGQLNQRQISRQGGLEPVTELLPRGNLQKFNLQNQSQTFAYSHSLPL